MKVPWDENRKRKTKGHLSEEKGAKRGKLQINSGRTWHSKRDFKKHGFLMENRETDRASYSIKKTELKKLNKDAIFEHSKPGMRIDFDGDVWVLITEHDFEDLNDS